jgi:diaminohydroxyphosphoribosylaminopyrimidine deaminase/5-amino-6-(5-phosphoribosylamino)uracil reductase
MFSLNEQMMRRALELAARGVGLVSPSPLVGCVVTDAAGAVAGEGFYLWDEVEHAEAIALRQAGERAKGGTAYVSLEPHSHQSRTPPCVDALIRAGVRRVVAPIEDPNPKVAGQGFAALREAGVEVVTGVLEREAAQLNEAYIHHQRTGRPFVHLKMACSLDGKIATCAGDAKWITGEQARRRVHEMRHQYDAILVGANTVAADDPQLTDRSGRARRRPLVRVVLDAHSYVGPQTRLARYAKAIPTIVFAYRNADESRLEKLRKCGVEVIRGEMNNHFTHHGRPAIDFVLRELAQRSIAGLLVEGGATVAAAFLKAKAVNKISFFIAPIIIGDDGIGAVAGRGATKVTQAARLHDVETHRHGEDTEITGYP